MGKEHGDPSKSLKRVTQACARCKIKKVKCCGSTPCSRCKADDAVCYYGARGANDKRMVSKTHLDRLQWQQKILMNALRALWRTTNNHSNESDEPSIHAIVASTGVLDDASKSQAPFSDWDFTFDEDFALTSSPDDVDGSLRSQSFTNDPGAWATDDTNYDNNNNTNNTNNAAFSNADFNDLLDGSMAFTSAAIESSQASQAFGESFYSGGGGGSGGGDAFATISPTLAQRRGAPSLPRCPIPPSGLEHVHSMDFVLTEPRNDVVA